MNELREEFRQRTLSEELPPHTSYTGWLEGQVNRFRKLSDKMGMILFSENIVVNP